MRWGRRKTQICPDKVLDQQNEKQFSLLSCLLSILLCICLHKESNEQPPKPEYPIPDFDPETKQNSSPNPKGPKPRPQPHAHQSVKHNFDITGRRKLGYKAPNRHGPSVIYGLDPMVQGRRSKGAKVATKIEEKDLEGFAVAKKSSNPERDFRESMVRMIRLKRITRAEDLENLLACYLVLNADEYHDVIVKVFRQVWIETSNSARLRSSRRPVRANRRG